MDGAVVFWEGFLINRGLPSYAIPFRCPLFVAWNLFHTFLFIAPCSPPSNSPAPVLSTAECVHCVQSAKALTSASPKFWACSSYCRSPNLVTTGMGRVHTISGRLLHLTFIWLWPGPVHYCFVWSP